MQEQVATKYESTMPKNVTFREDAVVVTHEQATTYEQMKNFILNKKNETKKKKSKTTGLAFSRFLFFSPSPSSLSFPLF